MMTKEERRTRLIRDHIDNMAWLVSLGTAEALGRVLEYVDHVRACHGSGWWDDTLARLEARARAARAALGG